MKMTSGNIMAILNVALGLSEKITVYGNDYPTKDGTGERYYIHIKMLLMDISKHIKILGMKSNMRYTILLQEISISVIDSN